MLRLVMKKIHPDKRPEAATDKSRQKQRPLRYAPTAVPCLIFIQAHLNKADDAHDDYIYDNSIVDHKISSIHVVVTASIPVSSFLSKKRAYSLYHINGMFSSRK